MNSPNKAEAEERFKEVQQAYDQIMKEKAAGLYLWKLWRIWKFLLLEQTVLLWRRYAECGFGRDAGGGQLYREPVL
ncbi:MAG: hypothetical protein V8S31_04240 [Lachnospiraceae bacterium]